MVLVQPDVLLHAGERWRLNALQEMGKEIYISEEDKAIDKAHMPIVIVFNGKNHFCGSWIPDIQQMNVSKLDRMFSYLNKALEMYNDIVSAGGLTDKNLQRNVALLMHDVTVVQNLMTAPTVPDELVALGPYTQVTPAPVVPVPTPAHAPEPPTQSTQSSSTQAVSSDDDGGGEEQPKQKKRRRVSSGHTYQCAECTHPPFAKKHDLDDHLKGMHRETPYSCCGHTYIYKKGYLRHMREDHAGSEGYKLSCSECGEGFRYSHRLADHLYRVHKVGQQNKCLYCRKPVSRENEKRHLKICRMNPYNKEDEGESFTCGQCGRVFYSKKGLHHHMTEHGSQSNIMCEVCAHGFPSQSTLLRHQRSMHNMHKEPEDLEVVSSEE